jgi:hypothetical protein
MRVTGHPQVVELLETYLALAKDPNHHFGSVGIVVTSAPGTCACDWAGDLQLEEKTLEAVDMLGERIKGSIANWKFPPRDETLDESFVRYNVAHSPLSYDFVVWLVDAEMTRIRAGAPAPLKVGFWLGQDPELRMNRDRRRLWINRVMRPALKLIGAVEDERALYGHSKPIFVARDITRFCKLGEKVPVLRPTKKWPSYGHVTITLREADHYDARNSQVDAWCKFASEIERTERVIFVRDTAKATEPLGGFETCPDASLYLEDRMALYASAKMNFFVSNGPIGLTIFGEAPFMAFITVQDEDDPLGCNRPEFWEAAYAIKIGEQFPWLRQDQKLVWLPDTFNNIKRAWEDWRAER